MTDIDTRPPTQPGFIENVTPLPEFVRNGTSGRKKAVYGIGGLVAILASGLTTWQLLEADVQEHHADIESHEDRIEGNEESIRVIRIEFIDLKESVQDGRDEQKEMAKGIKRIEDTVNTDKQKRKDDRIKELERRLERRRRGDP